MDEADAAGSLIDCLAARPRAPNKSLFEIIFIELRFNPLVVGNNLVVPSAGRSGSGESASTEVWVMPCKEYAWVL